MPTSRFDLTGRRSLVVGGGAMGLAMAQGLAEHGSDVAISDYHLEAAEAAAQRVEQAGRSGHALKCDITDPAGVDDMVNKAAEAMSGVDVLVTPVGSGGIGIPVLELTAERFDEVMHTYLRSILCLSRAVGRHMIDQGQGGAMVHISSIASLSAIGRGTGSYAAAKAGVNALVREMAVEWASHQIRVNAIAPCQIRTPALERVLADPKFGGRGVLEKKMLERIPAGRFGEPEDVVGPTIFLVSNAAAMVTGHLLMVDGGFSAQ